MPRTSLGRWAGRLFAVGIVLLTTLIIVYNTEALGDVFAQRTVGGLALWVVTSVLSPSYQEFGTALRSHWLSCGPFLGPALVAAATEMSEATRETLLSIDPTISSPRGTSLTRV